ncbi:MAG TPA: hypothetical protein GX687_04125 [Clostridia bacterium]|nr:hypothetical protein [Clostridia bacterium]
MEDLIGFLILLFIIVRAIRERSSEAVSLPEKEPVIEEPLIKPVKKEVVKEVPVKVAEDPSLEPCVEKVVPLRDRSLQVDLKQAIIWSEILQKPKALRRK